VSPFADPVVAWRGSTNPSAPIVALLHGRILTDLATTL